MGLTDSIEKVVEKIYAQTLELPEAIMAIGILMGRNSLLEEELAKLREEIYDAHHAAQGGGKGTSELGALVDGMFDNDYINYMETKKLMAEIERLRGKLGELADTRPTCTGEDMDMSAT